MPRYHAHPLVNLTDSISHQRGNQAQTFGLSSGPPCNEQLSAPIQATIRFPILRLGLGKRVLSAPIRAPFSPSCHKLNKAKSQSLAIKVSRPSPYLCLNTFRLLLGLRGSAVFSTDRSPDGGLERIHHRGWTPGATQAPSLRSASQPNHDRAKESTSSLSYV
jgi:hypothetical protein